MTETNSRTVVGLFDTFTEAQQVARDLEQQGFSRENISIVANDATGEYAGAGVADAGSGAGTGAAIGGAAGLALGLVALAIPGVGPIIAAGTLATALTGAGIGAVAGGLIGALTHMGVPEEEASYYSEGVKQGGALVMVKAEGDRAGRAASILERSGAESVDERGATGTKGGVRVYGATPGMSNSGYDAETRSHYQSNESPATAAYDSVNYDPGDPAYQYGSSLASDARYRGKEWGVIEPDVRRDWESRGEGAWDDVKDSVRHAWHKVTGQH
ncbi:MAG: general stress protein [Acidobacteriota bacterium]|nr:general stress protein [Acidobacteriota bacterium]